jgi:adenine-specific DNA-methyltransferase
MVGIASADRRPNLHYDLIHPETGVNYGCPDMGWRYDRTTMGRLITEKRIPWPSTPAGRPRRKAFLSELDSDFTGFSTVVGDGVFTRDGTADIDALFDTRVFTFPKPVRLISSLVEQGAGDGGIILDFFAGSGTTAHAVMAKSAADGHNRRYILVQLPEPLDATDRDQKTVADFCSQLKKPRNIAELTKERLRRAAKKIRDETPVLAKGGGWRSRFSRLQARLQQHPGVGTGPRRHREIAVRRRRAHQAGPHRTRHLV